MNVHYQCRWFLHYNEQADTDTSGQKAVVNQQELHQIHQICDTREGEKGRLYSTELTDTKAKEQETIWSTSWFSFKFGLVKSQAGFLNAYIKY